VTARGLLDPDVAATTVSNSMTIEVTAWNENVSHVEFVGTGDYIMVSTNSLELNPGTGSTNTFFVRSTVPFQWQLGTDGTIVESAAPTEESNANYTVIMTASAPVGDYTDYTFTVTALSDNDNVSDSRAAGIFIMAQGATLSVNVTQLASKALSTKVNVMSAGTSYGSLGESLQPLSGIYNDGTADQMRYILLNQANFGPSGTVKVGGFNLEYLDYGSFESDGNAARIAYILEHIDVLNMCYPVNTSAGVAKTICDWLWADENRVLFVMHDSATGNPNLIAEINSRVDSSYNTTWAAGGVIATSVGFSTLTVTSMRGLPPERAEGANLPFLQGPFGSLTDFTTVFKINDATCCGLRIGGNIVPLIYYSNATTRGVYAEAAIDVDHRIVYIGESQTFNDQMPDSTTAPSPTGGTLNLIYSNLWAWVVNTVLAD
jgi:hypothetical protein